MNEKTREHHYDMSMEIENTDLEQSIWIYRTFSPTHNPDSVHTHIGFSDANLPFEEKPGYEAEKLLIDGECDSHDVFKLEPKHKFYLQNRPRREIGSVELSCSFVTNPERDALIDAVKGNDLSSAENILKKGTEPNTTFDDTEQKRSEIMTPLKYAIRNKNPKMVKLLLDHGADVFFSCATEEAIQYYDERVFALIVAAMAPHNLDLNVCVDTLLISALENEQWDVAKYLLRHGADPKIPAASYEIKDKMPYCYLDHESLEDDEEMEDLMEAGGAGRRQARCREWRSKIEERGKGHRPPGFYPNLSIAAGGLQQMDIGHAGLLTADAALLTDFKSRDLNFRFGVGFGYHYNITQNRHMAEPYLKFHYSAIVSGDIGLVKELNGPTGQGPTGTGFQVGLSIDGFGVLIVMLMNAKYAPMITPFVRYHRMFESDWKHGIEWGIRMTFYLTDDGFDYQMKD